LGIDKFIPIHVGDEKYKIPNPTWVGYPRGVWISPLYASFLYEFELNCFIFLIKKE
jgi:hypothetical protein